MHFNSIRFCSLYTLSSMKCKELQCKGHMHLLYGVEVQIFMKLYSSTLWVGCYIGMSYAYSLGLLE